MPGIAEAIATKSEAETRAFLLLLQDAASRRPRAGLRLCDIPAAVDVSPECEEHLEHAADALAWFQERFEASQEQERYGRYWLITSHVAEQIEEATHGIAPSRSISVTSGNELGKPNNVGTMYDRAISSFVWSTDVNSACIQCKTDKRKCDHGLPCKRCSTFNLECAYPSEDGQGKAG